MTKGKFIVHTTKGDQITLHRSSGGYCCCPVCGYKSKNKEWLPYETNGEPLFDICPCCGFEYGFDDGGEPPYEKVWEVYRYSWLNSGAESTLAMQMSREAKLIQLKNIDWEP